jgi:hypothetical protein
MSTTKINEKAKELLNALNKPDEDEVDSPVSAR